MSPSDLFSVLQLQTAKTRKIIGKKAMLLIYAKLERSKTYDLLDAMYQAF